MSRFHCISVVKAAVRIYVVKITLWVDEPILSVFCQHDPAAFFITCNPIF